MPKAERAFAELTSTKFCAVPIEPFGHGRGMGFTTRSNASYGPRLRSLLAVWSRRRGSSQGEIRAANERTRRKPCTLAECRLAPFARAHSRLVLNAVLSSRAILMLFLTCANRSQRIAPIIPWWQTASPRSGIALGRVMHHGLGVTTAFRTSDGRMARC